MENKTSKKYDILMIIWGLLLGLIELFLIISGFLEKINVSFIKAPYAKNLLMFAIISIFFRIITYIIQLPYKRKLENKNKIKRNRHLALLCSIISITTMFFYNVEYRNKWGSRRPFVFDNIFNSSICFSSNSIFITNFLIIHIY